MALSQRYPYISHIFLFFLLSFMAVLHSASAQSVSHSYGSLCVNTEIVFTFTGQGTVNYWSVNGNPTIIDGGGTEKFVKVKWSSAGLKQVDVNYTDFNSTNTIYISPVIEDFVNPLVDISIPQTTFCEGSAVNFTATPTDGGDSPYYYWYVDDVQQVGENSATFSASSLSPGSHEVYVAMRTSKPCANDYTAESNPITVNVTERITMGASIRVVHPSNGVLYEGCNATFAVDVTNASGTLTYEWLRGDEVITSDVTNVQSNHMPVNSLQNGEVIQCRVYTDASCYTSPVSTTYTVSASTPDAFTVGIRGSDDGSAIDRYLCKNEEVTYYAISSHTATFQWYKGGRAVGTGNTYTTTATSVEDLKLISVTGTTNATCTRNNSTSASSSLESVPFTIYDPGEPTVEQPYIIEYNTSTTLSASGAKAGEVYRWYTTGSGGTPLGNTTTPALTQNTTYYVSRYVEAEGCEGPRKAFTVTVNRYPVANAGEDQIIVLPNNSVSLIGTGTDQDGTISSYRWTQEDGPSIALPENENSVLSLMNLVAGTYVFKLTVKDDYDWPASDQVTVTVVYPPNNYNYIRTTSTQIKDIKEISQLEALSVHEKSISTTYFDGLGRPMQEVAWQASPGENDIVQPVQYDQFGMEVRKYLPYVATEESGEYYPNAVKNPGNYHSSEQYSFYQDADKVAQDHFPFSEAVFEPSPLNRVIEQGAPGADWQPGTGHTINMTYKANVAEDRVINWVYAYAEEGFGQLLANGFFPDGQLFVTETDDEDEQLVREYTDKQGRLVLKEVRAVEGESLYTYYVYDDFGNLRAVLQPEFLKAWEDGGGVVQDPVDFEGYRVINEDMTITDCPAGKYYVRRGVRLTLGEGFCTGDNTEGDSFHVFYEDELEPVMAAVLTHYVFYYHYDERQRMVEKHVPGGGTTYMVYDQWDRLVLAQDEEQKDDRLWVYTKYDQLNRPVLTGLWEDANRRSREELQELLSDYSGRYELRAQAELHGYSTQQTFPDAIDDSQVLTATYYDDYAFGFLLDDANGTYAYQQPAVENKEFAAEAFSRVKGQVTGVRTKILGRNEWLQTVSYYDDRYRLIQSVTDNLQGGTDRLSNAYDFAGKLMYSLQQHQGHQQLSILKEFRYDHMGRLLDSRQTIAEGDNTFREEDKVLLAAHQYNALGELIDKKLHSQDGEHYKQSVDYRYNIRGWLTSINNSSLSQDARNDDSDDLFGMELAYTHDFGLGASKLNHNGNITAIRWSANAGFDADEKQRAYTYGYDGLNRINEASYHKKGAGWRAETAYALEGLEYDKNGNILKLNRRGADGSLMDQLVYDYEGNGNRLNWVSDNGDISQGFKDGNTTGDDYDYYKNGNLKLDKNKGISLIKYNYLNLPEEIYFENGEEIVYTYDAAGVKLSQLVIKNDNEPKLTEYVAGLVYEGEQLQFIQHEEGRVVYKSGEENPFEYQYHLKDHLGNVRMSFTSRDKVDEAVATMETAHEEEEWSEFLHYEEVTKINTELFDHTNEGGTYYSMRLSGAEREQIGLAKSLAVNPGDVVSAKVFAKYLDPNQDNWSEALVNLMAGIAGGTAPAGTFIEGAGISQQDFGFAGMLTKGETAQGVKAYLNVLIVDKNFNLLDGGYEAVGAAAKEDGSDVAHQELRSAEFTITQPGYVYIWLSNEGEQPVEVYFDDFTVTHEHSKVIQADDYYPFGLTFNSYQREGNVKNKYQYNQGTGEKAFNTERVEELELDMTKYRLYDYALGRFTSADPLADASPQENLTPYQYAYNNPVRYNDPYGDCVTCITSIIDWVKVKVFIKMNNKMNDAGLSPQEKKVAFKDPYGAYKARNLYQAARNLSQNLHKSGKMVGGTQGANNALRHALWMAQTTQTSGEDFAREIGIAHEDGVPDDDPNQRIVDLANNELGIQVGLDNPDASFKDLAKILIDKIAAGEALVIDIESGKVTKSTINSGDVKNAKECVDEIYNDQGQTAEQNLYNENF